MKKLTRLLAGVLCLAMLTTAAGCNKEKHTSPDSSATETADVSAEVSQETGETALTIDPNTIYWVADYDLNPAAGQEQSTALAMFEKQYNAKVEWIPATAENKYDILMQRVNTSEPVDMFPFDINTMPDGVSRELFDPLDDYMDLNDSVWDGVRDAIDMFAYAGKHYVVPYSVSDPLVLTYSRKLCKENGFDDPYTLYQQGKWDWNTMMDMMKQFADKESGNYGIAGWFASGLLHSSGQAVIGFDGNQFTNNIEHAEIGAAEGVLADIAKQGLYDATWYNHYPTSNKVLFYSMGDWALGASNAKNPDADIMVVPFPKSPNISEYYYSGGYNAKMLAADSEKGALVASYILCERMAAVNEEYQKTAKQEALTPVKNSLGETVGVVTEEQYDAIQQYQDSAKPLYEFGLGMGGMMYTNGAYTYETRGIMNNIFDGLLLYPDTGDTWEDLRDTLSPLIDMELDEYNLQ
ncbi:MAG: extracellular solute-binding protein [Oscillospiraceae bacterium]|nr:extracellular solute-binding protein [Oscillospiraceae bacterium]